jgi:16S rRNA C967 or C1407 C5-methylase (RsmB/RsmF family)/NOL1/NOP2/fmu family ribosome biogenesis protein
MMNLPPDLIRSLRGVTGFDESSFLQAHEEPPPVSIRVNREKLKELSLLSDSGLKIKSPIPWTSSGYYLEERPLFTLDPALHAGAYYVQEASSMFLEYLLHESLGEQRDLKVLDLCAAPGGKTTLLAGMQQFKLVLANEIIRTRVNILYENVVKWGDPKIFISNNDPAHFASLPDYFDVMMVDAPCSGSGLFRKDRDALDEWSIANVMHCAERQKRILADALPALKQNGLLIYSTCSYSKEEDEDLLDFLADHAALEPVDIDVPPEWGIVKTYGSKGGCGYRFFPGKTKGEGFFIACFRLKEQVVGKTDYRRRTMIRNTKASVPGNWLRQHLELETILAGEEIYCIPVELLEDHMALREVLNVRKSGVKAGFVGRNEFIPDHELVLSYLVSEQAPRMQLDRQEALKYLRKQVFDLRGGEKGWHIASYGNMALGLVKHLGNRLNNYYPASWRILMS